MKHVNVKICTLKQRRIQNSFIEKANEKLRDAYSNALVLDEDRQNEIL